MKQVDIVQDRWELINKAHLVVTIGLFILHSDQKYSTNNNISLFR